MMNIINGNILDIEHGVIVHQVNCMGVMGSGLALQIRKKYPEVYDEYLKISHPNVRGRCQIVQTSNPNLKIANIFGQIGYGRYERHTDYSLLENGLLELSEMVCDSEIYIPHGIGCGLGGGDWRIVKGVIEKVIPDCTIVKFGG